MYALIGFLSAALGPLKSAELSSASPILRKGMLLERELSGVAAKLVRGEARSERRERVLGHGKRVGPDGAGDGDPSLPDGVADRVSAG